MNKLIDQKFIDLVVNSAVQQGGRYYFDINRYVDTYGAMGVNYRNLMVNSGYVL